MIVNAGHKSLAFGMNWQAILHGNGATAQKQIQPDENGRLPLVWRGKDAVFMGILGADLVPVDNKDKIYAAALAFAAFSSTRIDEMSNGACAFIFDFGGDVGFCFIGVIDRRPRQNFDLVGLTKAQVVTCARRFLATTSAHRVMVFGNVDLGEREFPWVEATLTNLANVVTPEIALKQIRQIPYVEGVKKGIPIALTCVLLGAWWHIKHPLHRENEVVVDPVPVRYSKQLDKDGERKIVSPVELARWIPAFRAVPMSLGGWALADATCKASNGDLPCTLTYKAISDLATNKSFFDKKPATWVVTSVDSTRGEVINVTVPSPALEGTPLSDRFGHLPNEGWLLVSFASKLQSLRRVTTETSVGLPVVFGQLADVAPALIPHAVKTASWSLSGPARDIGLIASFPPNVEVDSVFVTFSQTELDVTANASPIQLVVKGHVYVRD